MELMLSGVRLRRGARWPGQLLLVVALGLGVMALAWCVGDLWQWFAQRLEVFLLLGGIGCGAIGGIVTAALASR